MLWRLKELIERGNVGTGQKSVYVFSPWQILRETVYGIMELQMVLLMEHCSQVLGTSVLEVITHKTPKRINIVLLANTFLCKELPWKKPELQVCLSDCIWQNSICQLFFFKLSCNYLYSYHHVRMIFGIKLYLKWSPFITVSRQINIWVRDVGSIVQENQIAIVTYNL